MEVWLPEWEVKGKNGELLSSRYRVSVRENAKVLEREDGEGCMLCE